MTLFETVCDQLNQNNYESPVISAIISLNAALKIYGHQTELLYKDQVDKLQVCAYLCRLIITANSCKIFSRSISKSN